MLIGEQKRVIVLGAGVSGLTCARELARRMPYAQITVVDRLNEVPIDCLLPQAVFGHHIPKRVFMRPGQESGPLLFRQAEVLGIDLALKTIRIRDVDSVVPESLEYDHVVLALGERPVLESNDKLYVRSFADAWVARFTLSATTSPQSVVTIVPSEPAEVVKRTGGLLWMEDRPVTASDGRLLDVPAAWAIGPSAQSSHSGPERIKEGLQCARNVVAAISGDDTVALTAPQISLKDRLRSVPLLGWRGAFAGQVVSAPAHPTPESCSKRARAFLN